MSMDPSFRWDDESKGAAFNSVIPEYAETTSKKPTTLKTVIPAKAGIHAHSGSEYHSVAAQRKPLDPSFRWDDD